MRENFPSNSSRRDFLQAAGGLAVGWSIGTATGLSAVTNVFAADDTKPAGLPHRAITCSGRYGGHLQGVCADPTGHVYWSFTTAIVKTDSQGHIVKQVAAPTHQGDLCYRDGKVYVAVNLGKFNQPPGQADSWVFVFDATTLKELARHPVPQAVHGAGGMESRNGRFYVVGGLPDDYTENYVYEYDEKFEFIQRHIVASGHTYKGIQTACFHDDAWWFGCYGSPAELVKTAPDFKVLGRWKFDCALGIVGVGEGKFLVGRGRRDAEGYDGRLIPAVSNTETGLKLTES